VRLLRGRITNSGTESLVRLDPTCDTIDALAQIPMNKKLAGLIAIIAGLAAATAQAISLTGGTYSENFDSMGTTGTTAPTGWSSDTVTNTAAAGTATDAPNTTGTVVGSSSTVVASTGTGTAGAEYNYGVAGTNVVGERALGSLAGSNLQRDTYASFTNNVGVTLTQFTIKYDGEQWRLGQAVAATNVLTLQYSPDGTTGSWVALGTGFNFTSPITSGAMGAALDGNNSANRVANIGGTYIPASGITNGSTFYLRWADPDDGGSDAGMAIDNFSITVVPEPSTWFAGGLMFVGLISSQRRGLSRLLKRA
jgi:hypothetical protein